jgi:hypothetical protein
LPWSPGPGPGSLGARARCSTGKGSAQTAEEEDSQYEGAVQKGSVNSELVLGTVKMTSAGSVAEVGQSATMKHWHAAHSRLGPISIGQA